MSEAGERKAAVERKTRETEVRVAIDLDGSVPLLPGMRNDLHGQLVFGPKDPLGWRHAGLRTPLRIVRPLLG